MANIFAILTVVALAVSAFFAYKNQQAFKSGVETLEIAKSDVVNNQELLRENTAERDQAIADRRAAEEATVTLREREAQIEGAISEVEEQLAAQRAKAEANAAQIDRIKEQTAEFGEMRELAGRIQRLKEEIAELEDQKIPVLARRRELLAQKAGIDEQIDVYEGENVASRAGRSYFDSTRISSVFPNWGFVTLPIGDAAGVVTGSTLDVVRDGETVAKLRVRSVESNRSSADVIPDSVAEGVSLRPGDRVVPSDDAADTAQASN